MNVLEGKEFEVEDIIHSKMERGKEWFLIKWKNYDKSHNSWQPKGNLNKALLKFWNMKKKEAALIKKNPFVFDYACPLRNLIWPPTSTREGLDAPEPETEAMDFDEVADPEVEQGHAEEGMDQYESMEEPVAASTPQTSVRKRVGFKIYSSVLQFDKNESVIDLTAEAPQLIDTFENEVSDDEN